MTENIMDSFNEKYKKGILSKRLFLDSTITCEFIEWFIDFNNGNRSLKDLRYEYISLNDCIEKYSWSEDKTFIHTLERFRKWNAQMKSSNDSELLSICLEILKWGGVSSKNKNKIEQITSLKDFLKSINEIIKKSEIVINDLNPNYINSGFTKLYTAFIKDFIMYDGRVGSALCYCISAYLKEKRINELPTELIFGWGQGRSTKYNRNPNDELNNFKFPEITRNRSCHFISNIKANWLLGSISEKIILLDIIDKNEKVFALQTALFVLGQNIPKNEYKN